MAVDDIVRRAAAEEKRDRARQLRMKRPACKSLCWGQIQSDLSDIREEVSEIQWMGGDDYEKLYNALDGDEAIFEFQIAFSDLAGECEKMYEDLETLRDREAELLGYDTEYDDPPALFDMFFPAINCDDDIFGYDIEEHDYYSFDSWGDDDYARKKARDKLKRLTKDQLLDLAGLCMEIARQYMSITSRYDALSTSIAILKGESEALLKVVTRIEALYDSAAEETENFKYDYGKSLRELESALRELPERLWIE